MNLPLPPSMEAVLEALYQDDTRGRCAIQQHEWELRTFFTLVLTELRPQRTVELGTWIGGMSTLLSQSTEGKTVTVDSIDYGRHPVTAFGRNLHFLSADCCGLDVPAKAVEMLGGPIDLLFVDDGHYYDQIVRQCAIWIPQVRPGGWVAFHDINPLANLEANGQHPDCVQAARHWKEMTGNKQDIIATEAHREYRGVIPHGGIGLLKL